MRIGPRNDYTVSNIVTCDGHKLPWSNEIRYLGTYIVQSRQFKCSLDYAKKIVLSFAAATRSFVSPWSGSSNNEEETKHQTN